MKASITQQRASEESGDWNNFQMKHKASINDKF